MQPDYNRLWPTINNGQPSDAHFYAFFEDSLNQFISANSNDSKPVANSKMQQQENDTNKNE